MQSLFELDFRECAEEKADEVIKRNVREFASGIEDSSFVETLVRGTLKYRKRIDELVEKCAPEWPIDQITSVDRNILRMGIYELMFGNYEEVPPKVAINEAIELAKTFGGESSSRFVNGVLGTIYREMGEPLKDDDIQKKQKREETKKENDK